MDTAGEVRMKNVPWKDIALIAAIIYFLSPLDLAPGILVDDLAALGADLFMNGRRSGFPLTTGCT